MSALNDIMNKEEPTYLDVAVVSVAGTSWSLAEKAAAELAQLRDELTMRTLENIKGSSVLDDKNEQIAARMAAIEQAQKLVCLWRKEGEKRHDAQGQSYIILSVLAGCAEALATALEGTK